LLAWSGGCSYCLPLQTVPSKMTHCWWASFSRLAEAVYSSTATGRSITQHILVHCCIGRLQNWRLNMQILLPGGSQNPDTNILRHWDHQPAHATNTYWRCVGTILGKHQQFGSQATCMQLHVGWMKIHPTDRYNWNAS
jgi:hypothetical protein